MTKDEILAVIEKKITKDQYWILDNLVVLHIAGSRLYGTNNEMSDYDYRGITIPSTEHWVGLPSFEQLELKLPEINAEITIYDIRKWMKLASGMNPNVIETLFVPTDKVLYKSCCLDAIKKNQEHFLNKKVLYSFGGFAKSQYYKLLEKQQNETGRQNLVFKYGFDTKFASHSVRILTQGIELLRTHKITYPLTNADYVKGIRTGKLTQVECCEVIEKLLQELEIAAKESTLPETFNYHALNKLQIDIFFDYIMGIY